MQLSLRGKLAATVATLAIVAITPAAGYLAVPQCVSEDSSQPVCRWDAQSQGNGRGQSFVKIGNLYL